MFKQRFNKVWDRIWKVGRFQSGKRLYYRVEILERRQICAYRTSATDPSYNKGQRHDELRQKRFK